jgi:hypothetical protein
VKRSVAIITLVILALAFSAPMLAQGSKSADSSAEQKRFHDVYKELVEINTTHSVGDNTQAARAMQKHFIEAGFTADEI